MCDFLDGEIEREMEALMAKYEQDKMLSDYTRKTFKSILPALGYTDVLFSTTNLDRDFKPSKSSGHSDNNFCIISNPRTFVRPVIIIVEYDYDINNHAPNPGADEDTDKYVTSRVKDSMASFWTSGTRKEDVVGIALTHNKDTQERKITFFGICSQHNTISDYKIKCLSSSGEDIKFSVNPTKNKDDLLSLLYSLDDISGGNSICANGTNFYKIPCNLLSRINIEIASVQRSYSEAHVIKIRDELSKLGKQDVVPKGVIQVVENRFSYSVIDGQHRLRAYIDLAKNGYQFDVMVQLIPVISKEEIADVYQEHNKAMAPSEYEKGGDNKLENPSYVMSIAVIEKLQKAFTTKVNGKYLFTEGRGRTNKPRLCRHERIDELMNYFDTNEKGIYLIKKMTADQLFHIIMRTNKELPTTVRASKGRSYAVSTLNICERYDCYLGLVKCREWFNIR